MSTGERPSARLLAISILAALLATATSLAGIFWRVAYARETPAWAVQGVGQDIANLPVALMLMACASRLRGRDPLAALCVWLGSLLYFIYAFAIYAFGVHFGALFLAYVAVLGLSFHAFAGALASLDVAAVVAPLRDHPARNGAGNLLIAIAVIFAGLWLGEDVPHVLANSPPPSLGETGLLTNPVHVLDLAIVLPAMVVVGVQMKRQQTWGLLLAPVLLVFTVTMGVAILALFAMSAAHGLPVAAPAVVMVAAIVLLSGGFAARLLGRPA